MESKPKVLVVDDELGPREALRMILRDDYNVVAAANGSEALDYISSLEFDLAILDIRMPDINGIDLLQEVKEKAPDTEVVMITAYASIETATSALRLGALDYIIKPFDRSSVQDVVKKGLSRRKNSMSIKNRLKELQLANKQLEDQIELAYQNIQSHYTETVHSLVAAIDAKDSYTKGHQERMARFAVDIGRKMGIPDEELMLLQQAATLHDIGKIGVPEKILRKKGALTPSEFKVVKQHPVIGAEIISPVQFLSGVIPLVRHHHERYDGTGYPSGLQGSEIPLGARIIAIADAVDAMLSERPYAPARSLWEVKEQLQTHAGTQFDPQLVEIVLLLLHKK